MPPLRLLLVLFLVVAAPLAGAEALAVDGSGRCVRANIELQPAATGAHLYRIVFLNHCDAPRSLIWCAEHPAAPLPPVVACTRAQGVGPFAESRHLIRLRKEFQWHLPPGARIRFHDCPGEELPTPEFGCAPPAPPPASRR